ncbi:hypothetical protein JCM5353_001338 [Sporobolomyces roseus]
MDIQHLKAVATASTQYLIVWTALLVWDSLATFPTEYRVIWKRRWTPLKAVFLLNRYGTLILEIASATMILTPMSKEACDRIFWIQPVTIVFVILLIGLLVVEAIGCIIGASQIRPLGLPPFIAELLDLRGCLVVGKDEASKFVFLLALFPFIFDTFILALVIFRTISLQRQIGSHIPILQRILRDGILFYLAITATHVVTTILWFQSDLTVKSFNVPASIVLPSLMCSRLVLSLLSRPPDAPRLLATFTPKRPSGQGIAPDPTIETRGVSAGMVSGTTTNHVNPLSYGRTSLERDDTASTSSSKPLPILPSPPPALLRNSSISEPPPRTNTPPPNPNRLSEPIRPSLKSKKSEHTLESIRSRRSQMLDNPILAIQVTKETFVSVVKDTENPDDIPLSSPPLSTPSEKEQCWPFPEGDYFGTYGESAK